MALLLTRDVLTRDGRARKQAQGEWLILRTLSTSLADPDPQGHKDILLLPSRMAPGLKTGSREPRKLLSVQAIDETLQYLPQVSLSLAEHALALSSPADGKTDPFLAVGSHLSHQGLFLFTCPSSSPPSLAKFSV